jgi:hypothetical protein
MKEVVCLELPHDVLSCLVKELGADVNQRDKHGWTALAAAAYLCRHDTARHLVEVLGANVSIGDNLDQTTLFSAAFQGQLDVVRVRFRLGADINTANTFGIIPLMAATVRKRQEVVKWLVKAGAVTKIDEETMSAAEISRAVGASAEQTAYLEAKAHCSSPGCSGAGIMKCTGSKQVRYCGKSCQLAHWKAHKADCRRWSAELAAGVGH